MPYPCCCDGPAPPECCAAASTKNEPRKGKDGKSRKQPVKPTPIPVPELDAAHEINHIYRVGTCQPGLRTRTCFTVS